MLKKSVRKKTQPDFFENSETRGRKRKIPLNVHGGSHHMNYNPAKARPLHTKKALHVVPSIDTPRKMV